MGATWKWKRSWRSQRCTAGALRVDRSSETTWTWEPEGTSRFTSFMEAMESALVWLPRTAVITDHVAVFDAANRSRVPLRSSSPVARRGAAFSMGSVGAVRSELHPSSAAISTWVRLPSAQAARCGTPTPATTNGAAPSAAVSPERCR